ncbi:MAG: HypC/HybG/HupF family hydrogenase formation chaperone [Candidatus Omnitrophota bacterium]
MCLAVPVKIKSIKGNTAVICAAGAQRTIAIELTPGVKIGDYVLLHAGFAIEVINDKDAKETLKLLKEMFEK